MKKEISQKKAIDTVIPDCMHPVVNELRSALFDNPCVILDLPQKDLHEAGFNSGENNYFFSDVDLYNAICRVIKKLPDYNLFLSILLGDINRNQEWLQKIYDIADAWDEEGATIPKPPLSWESAARLSMDYAKKGLLG